MRRRGVLDAQASGSARQRRPEPAVRLCHQRRGAASPNRPSVAPRSIVQSPKVGSADFSGFRCAVHEGPLPPLL